MAQEDCVVIAVTLYAIGFSTATRFSDDVVLLAEKTTFTLASTAEHDVTLRLNRSKTLLNDREADWPISASELK